MLPPKQGLTRSSRIAQPTRMQVVVRVRPPTKAELESGVGNLTFLDNSIQIKANATKRQSQVVDEPVIADNTQTRERRFTFDHLFEPSSTQAEVYYSIGQDLVDAALSGINAALMCYGVTGSGKTYSLSNLTPNHEGLVVRCCSHLFNKAAEENTDISISVSYYQIYLEQVYDLLAFEAGEAGPQVKSIEQRTKKLSDPKQFIPGLPVRENRDGTVFVESLSSHICRSMNELQQLLAIGENNKIFAATQMNQASSRSHVILDLKITINSGVSGSNSRFSTEKYTSNFLFVDLAGSERQSKTEAAGRRLEEAKFINKSLSALGKIVAALSNKGAAEMKSADSAQGSQTPKQRSISSANQTPSISKDPLYCDDFSDDDINSSGCFSSRSSNVSTRSHSPSVNSMKSASRDSLLDDCTKTHIPWRDSKLTRLLKNVLGGNSRATLMINISPSNDMIQETVTSLLFGRRAMSIVQAPKVNVAGSIKALSEQMQAEMIDLRETLMRKEDENTKLKTFVVELERTINTLNDQLDEKNRDLIETENYYKEVLAKLRPKSNRASCLTDVSGSADSPTMHPYSKNEISISPHHRQSDDGPLLADHHTRSPGDSGFVDRLMGTSKRLSDCDIGANDHSNLTKGMTVDSISTSVATKALLTSRNVYDGVPRYSSVDQNDLDYASVVSGLCSPGRHSQPKKRAPHNFRDSTSSTVMQEEGFASTAMSPITGSGSFRDNRPNALRQSLNSHKPDADWDINQFRVEYHTLLAKYQLLQTKVESVRDGSVTDSNLGVSEDLSSYIQRLAVVMFINYAESYGVLPVHTTKLNSLLLQFNGNTSSTLINIIKELLKLEVLLLIASDNKVQMKDIMSAAIANTARLAPGDLPGRQISTAILSTCSNPNNPLPVDSFISEDLFAWIKDIDENALLDKQKCKFAEAIQADVPPSSTLVGSQITVRSHSNAGVRDPSKVGGRPGASLSGDVDVVSVETQTTYTSDDFIVANDQIASFGSSKVITFRENAPKTSIQQFDKMNLYEINKMCNNLASAKSQADIPHTIVENLAIQSVRLFADIVNSVSTSTNATKANLSAFETGTNCLTRNLEFSKLMDTNLSSLNNDFTLLREIIIVYELYIEKLIELMNASPVSDHGSMDTGAFNSILSQLSNSLQLSPVTCLSALGRQLSLCKTPSAAIRSIADYFANSMSHSVE